VTLHKIFSVNGGHGGKLVGIMFAEASCLYIPVKLCVLYYAHRFCRTLEMSEVFSVVLMKIQVSWNVTTFLRVSSCISEERNASVFRVRQSKYLCDLVSKVTL